MAVWVSVVLPEHIRPGMAGAAGLRLAARLRGTHHLSWNLAADA
jgi:hypothetical protein